MVQIIRYKLPTGAAEKIEQILAQEVVGNASGWSITQNGGDKITKILEKRGLSRSISRDSGARDFQPATLQELIDDLKTMLPIPVSIDTPSTIPDMPKKKGRKKAEETKPVFPVPETKEQKIIILEGTLTKEDIDRGKPKPGIKATYWKWILGTLLPPNRLNSFGMCTGDTSGTEDPLKAVEAHADTHNDHIKNSALECFTFFKNDYGVHNYFIDQTYALNKGDPAGNVVPLTKEARKLLNDYPLSGADSWFSRPAANKHTRKYGRNIPHAGIASMAIEKNGPFYKGTPCKLLDESAVYCRDSKTYKRVSEVNWELLETAKPTGKAAYDAKIHVLKLLKANSTKIAFEPGETVIFDNKELLHAREPQTRAFRKNYPQYARDRKATVKDAHREEQEIHDRLAEFKGSPGFAEKVDELGKIRISDRINSLDTSDEFAEAVKKVVEGRLFNRFFIEINPTDTTPNL